MQSQKLKQNPNQIKAIILLEQQKVFMHRLLLNEKSIFTSGTCKIAAIQSKQGQPVYFINLGSFYYGINSSTFFIKMQYSQTVSYIFPHFQNGLSAISFQKYNDNLQNGRKLEQILKDAADVYKLQEAFNHENVRKLIETHYSNVKDQIYYPDNIKKAISLSGKYINQAFTFIGSALQTGVSTVGNFINEKITEPERKAQVEPQTREKWQNIKSKATSFLKISTEFANNLLTPIVTKTKEIAQGINENIEASDNKTIKYAKEIAQVSGKAIQEAFDGLVKGGEKVGKEIGQQGKKIIEKKYGEDVVRVMVQPVEDPQEKNNISPKEEQFLDAAIEKEQINKVEEQAIDKANEIIYPDLIIDK